MFPSFLLIIYLLVTPTVAHTVSWLRKFSLAHIPGTDVGPGAHEGPTNGWLWQWAWAADGTVSIVDRTPAITFPARPASFGLELLDPLLGYVIPLSSFTAPCPRSNDTSSTSFWSRTPVSFRFGRKYEPDPVLGCPELCISGPNVPDQDEKWIALVQRGGCPFVDKARMAQKLGASAVVVGGDRENPDALLNMYSENASDVKIAATYIKYWDYLQLSSLIASSNTSHNGLRTLSLLITTEYSAWEWYSPIITFIVILLLPTLLTFLTLLIHRIRAARAAQRDRAPEEFVHRLPWRVWTGTGWEKHDPIIEHPPPHPHSFLPTLHTPGHARASSADSSRRDLERGEVVEEEELRIRREQELEEEEEPEWMEHQSECAICLEMFAKGERVRVLPCGHMFHLDEVDEWLINRKKLCPVCKADVTQPQSRLPHQHITPVSASTLLPPPPPSSSASSSLGSSPVAPSPISLPASLATPTERTPLLHSSASSP
ncbi:unnamed protein product [Somion occarium]|uniref:RING-type E3 ubiquitin transferase n=1 Tax=Somion occarium TaxID=3059160 RepID=A0ABP1DX38_9APHY